MTAKEELKQLILSLSNEQLEAALKVFQAYSAERQEEQRPHFPID